MTFSVTSHGGFVCGVKHLYGFPSMGPSMVLRPVPANAAKSYPSQFYPTGYLPRPAETGEARLRAIVHSLKCMYAGQSIQCFLKAGVAGAGKEKFRTHSWTPEQIAAAYPGHSQILFEPLLLELGFKRVGPQFYNSNSFNWLRQYQLTITPAMHKEATKAKAAKKSAFGR